MVAFSCDILIKNLCFIPVIITPASYHDQQPVSNCLMMAFVFANWLCLRYKLSAILSIVVCTTMNFRYFTYPVAMSGTDWRGPLQCICTPWISNGYFSTFKN